jgi:glucokinase
LTVIIKEFLTNHPVPLVACIAIAGPVKNNNCHVTNLNWNLNGDEMAHALNIAAFVLINDFVAIGYGLLALKPDDRIQLNEAQPAPGAPIACLGAGTGLGEVYLTNHGSNYEVCHFFFF